MGTGRIEKTWSEGHSLGYGGSRRPNQLSFVVKQPSYDLIQVQVQVNGKYVRVLLDIDADNNYLAQHMVDRLRLNLSKCSRRVKAVNLGVVAVLSETKIESGVMAESVGLVDVLQTSMASSSGPVEFQRKLGDCLRLGRGLSSK
ncbi:hypothetical protein ACOSQ3_032029 [Xanthoceras sorbifolium]